MKTLKTHKFRERLSLNQFLALMLTITINWSLDRNLTKISDKLNYKKPPLTDSRW